jgi:hypothetical protein
MMAKTKYNAISTGLLTAMLIFMVGTALSSMSSLSAQDASAQDATFVDPHPHWHPPPGPTAVGCYIH